MLTLLLDNAIKFTHAGKVTLGAGCVHDQGKGWMLELFVEDSGIGIAEAHTHRLFRPFSPVDASTTRAYQGIGMGLALAAVLVEAMGGTVDVESTLGRGSRFRVSAPAEPAPP